MVDLRHAVEKEKKKEGAFCRRRGGAGFGLTPMDPCCSTVVVLRGSDRACMYGSYRSGGLLLRALGWL